jgi:hypothetical protein
MAVSENLIYPPGFPVKVSSLAENVTEQPAKEDFGLKWTGKKGI